MCSLSNSEPSSVGEAKGKRTSNSETVEIKADTGFNKDDPEITQKPNISTSRLSYIVPSGGVGNPNLGDKSSFTFEDLDQMAELYPWPKGVTLRLPVAHGGSLAKYPNSLVVHEESLKAGFRLPIPSFLTELLRWTELCPAQFAPNAWRCASAYGIRCWELNKEPSFIGMQCLFDLRDIGGGAFSFASREPDFVSLPNDIKNWKQKWFLVTKGDGFDFNFPIHPGRVIKFLKRSAIKEIPGEVQELKDSLQRCQTTLLHSSQVITLENLENAGLSLPHQTARTSTMKSAIKEQCEKASKRQTGYHPHLEKGEERPTKKRVESIHFSPVQPSVKSSNVKSDYLVSNPTLEEAKKLLIGATLNVNVVSTLRRLPDEQVSAELARATALQVYHTNNLIEKHEKLRSVHLASHAKLRRLEEKSLEEEEMKKELLCGMKSANQKEESLNKEIQSLKDELKRAQEEKETLGIQAREIRKEKRKLQWQVEEQHRQIQDLKMDLSEAKYRRASALGSPEAQIVEFEPDFESFQSLHYILIPHLLEFLPLKAIMLVLRQYLFVHMFGSCG